MYQRLLTGDWRQFERVVASIHIAEMQGAEVNWNETIQGRQFDVTIRFTMGPHNYLTLIECKNYSKPITVDIVDAFATKSRDAKANKAIIISSSKFQSGCIKIAKKHNIDLFTLSEKLIIPDELLGPYTGSGWIVYEVKIHFDKKSSSIYTFPQHPGRMRPCAIHLSGFVAKPPSTNSWPIPSSTW